MQKEKIIQHKLVMWFSQTYPEYHGHLFAVNNDTFSAKDANIKKAIGLLPGVADLIFIIPLKGLMCGIEMKAPDSYHKIDHIENQLKWGMNLITNKGHYLMTSNLEACQMLISALITSKADIYNNIEFKAYQIVKEKIMLAKDDGKKNIKF